MTTRTLPALAAIAFLVTPGLFTPAFGQQVERDPRPAGEPRSQPYLQGSPVDFRTLLAPPPALDSREDKVDQHTIDELQTVSDARWQSAKLDDAFVFPRFDEAFGKPVDRKTSPVLIALLNRALRDVAATTFAAKEHFQRPRPYQRFQLKKMCAVPTPPKPEINPTRGSSYPSGHTSYGWAVAMVLARVAPERSEALMKRADEYAESRLICGMHFPSDTYGGHVVAAAVLSRLDAVPEFQADVARARQEYASQ